MLCTTAGGDTELLDSINLAIIATNSACHKVGDHDRSSSSAQELHPFDMKRKKIYSLPLHGSCVSHGDTHEAQGGMHMRAELRSSPLSELGPIQLDLCISCLHVVLKAPVKIDVQPRPT